MGRIASWRKEDLGWVCGNPDWRNPASYGLDSRTQLHRWAWEFLRRNSKYRQAVDQGDQRSAGSWGLASLANYETPAKAARPGEPMWLAIQAYKLFIDCGELPELGEKQVAVIFNFRHSLPLRVLQRQLGQLAEHLHMLGRGNWAATSEKSRNGGRKYGAESLLLYLRFADAVAQDRAVSSEELAETLALGQRFSKRLNEIHVNVRSLISEDYLRLVDQALPSLRHTPRALRTGKPISF